MQRPTLHDWAVLHDWDRNSIDNLMNSIECHSERIGNLKQSIWEYKTFPERHEATFGKCLDRHIEHLEKLLEQEKNSLARSKNDLSVHLIWLFNRIKKGDYTPDTDRWIHMKRTPTNSGAN
jgi:hypothetical protein